MFGSFAIIREGQTVEECGALVERALQTGTIPPELRTAPETVGEFYERIGYVHWVLRNQWGYSKRWWFRNEAHNRPGRIRRVRWYRIRRRVKAALQRLGIVRSVSFAGSGGHEARP